MATPAVADVDDFLAHYGVPGMKWGKRKAGETDSSRRRDNQKNLEKFGKDRLKANDGSRKKAIAKSVGKSLATNFLVNVGASTINSLSGNHPSVVAGTTAVGLIIQGIGIGKTVNEIRAVNAATRKADAKKG